MWHVRTSLSGQNGASFISFHLSMSLSELFPETDYRFSMRFERKSPQEFFARTKNGSSLLAKRRQWLNSAPATYAGLLPEGQVFLEEAIDLAQSWGAVSPAGFSLQPERAWDDCLTLGKCLEPDFLLLQPDLAGSPRLLGGVVCFPSHWSLADKLGKPMSLIHEVVPGLNDTLGKQIGSFLNKLRPGVAWLRSNWGIARTPELNDHPSRALPRLGPEVTTEEVWLRLEHQALVALPKTGGILFGIRVEVIPLAELKREAAPTKGLIRALETMPDDLARYKGLATARNRLLKLLQP
ncbi:MAG: hypothetical protein JWM16_1426 [Verrucomicrobiales bacterium]|nr:hypothetical protein [Verrucomicrobiales bacterium]